MAGLSFDEHDSSMEKSLYGNVVRDSKGKVCGSKVVMVVVGLFLLAWWFLKHACCLATNFAS
jgi:hypothetical protein